MDVSLHDDTLILEAMGQNAPSRVIVTIAKDLRTQYTSCLVEERRDVH